LPELDSTNQSPAAPVGLDRPSDRGSTIPYARAEQRVEAGPDAVRPRWLILLLISLLAVVAAVIDQRAPHWLTKEGVRRAIIIMFGGPAAAGLYLLLLAILASFPNRRRLWVGFLAAVLLSALMTHALKWTVGRARPHMNLGAATFNFFNGFNDLETFARNGNYESFPSGHASGAATLAVLLGLYFPRARWMFYFGAGLVGLERIINDKHFLSDVLAGYVIGAVAVYLCARMLGSSFYQKYRSPVALPL
jgi:membrane-associated phospholipid phosphatase